MHDRVLGWLGNDENGLGYYLHFLTLRFSSAEYPQALARLREIIPLLEEQPDYWAEIARGPSWRPQLVGCAALLLARNRGFLDAQVASFAHPSFVCPQAAVAFGLLHPDEARQFFEDYLRGQDVKNDAKMTGAAHRTLLKLGSPVAESFDMRAFDAAPPFGESESHWHMNCGIGEGVVEGHWTAWNEILTAG